MWNGRKLSIWFMMWSVLDVLENLSLYDFPPTTVRDTLYRTMFAVCNKYDNKKVKDI